MTPTDAQILGVIDDLLQDRMPTATICPSEVARALAPQQWRPLMPRVREVALAAARAGQLEVLQRGNRLDPQHVPRGPIRLGRPLSISPSVVRRE